MTLYLSYNIDTKQEKILAAAWSNTDIPVLAMSTEKAKITFYQDEALNIPEHDIVKENLISALSWHPSEMIIAYGYIDGKIGVWIDEENIHKDEKTSHDSKITIIKFNQSGNRIVSVDEKGLIIVWRFEPTSASNCLQKLCTYKQNFIVEEILFPKFLYEKMDASKVPPPEKLDTLFFFCNSGGLLHLADDASSSPEICRVGGKIKSLLFYEKENAIIILTSHMLLVKCTIHFNQQLTPKKIKLSIAGNPDSIKCCWAGEGLIAIVSGDDNVRLFYLDTDQSYFLTMSDHELGKNYIDDCFNCIDFNYRKRTLVVGSAKGRVYMWKCNLTASIIPVTADSWEPFCIVETIQNINEINWSLFMGLLYISNSKGNYAMLSETILQKKMNKEIKIVQTSHKTLELITNTENKYSATSSTAHNVNLNIKKIEMSETIKGMDLFNNILITWNGHNLNLFEINTQTLVISKIHSFQLKSTMITLNEDSIISVNGKYLDIYSYEGELKNKINSEYGEIISFNVFSKYLCIVTNQNYFSVFDITRRNLKQIVSSRKFEKNGESLGEIREAYVNIKSNYIAILADTNRDSEMRIPQTKLFIFDVEMDSFSEFEISPNRIPVEIVWDQEDPRLFGVSTEYAKDLVEENNENKYLFEHTAQKTNSLMKNGNHSNNSLNTNYTISNFKTGSGISDKKEWIRSEFYVFFYTTEFGIHLQEAHPIKGDIQGVFALNIPSIYFIVSKTSEKQTSSLLIKKFQFFEGLDKIDENVKAALIDFSIYMSCGKLDEAYKIVKNIKNPLIWENMAQICIKTKRIDVLEVCLSNMRFSRGMKALRESKHEKELEARLALVAMHLNMIEDAKTLLQEVGRYDVLIRFYITIGEYDKAIQTAKNHDRINLENTYYRIAEHYDRINDIDKAIEFYKLSKCGSREIPRMLVQKNRIDLLENYMGKGEDKNTLNWWATYLESQGNLENALQYYKKAQDYSNMVRILLSQGKFQEAKNISDESKDQGACFLLGKYYESINDIRMAIYYYALSGRINQAFRLAREHNMDSDIFNLALKAPSLTQNLIAEYFENKGNYEKAINLYLLSGKIKRALNLCLITQQYDKIREIADSVEYRNDKDTLRALAEYFAEQKQFEKSLSLYIKLKDYDMSMKLCENHKVKISLQTSNAILEEIENEKDNKTKNDLTNRLAKLLMMQGDFEAAHQIHVKLGNLKKAMKCLIKMGNKDRVIEFAQTCRISELYIMSANFLQSLDWNENEDIVKNIVLFYNKAKAYNNLANFYELFANVEINEFRNYERAIVLYQESINAIEKVKDDEEKKNEKIDNLNKKIKITKLFLHVMNISKDDHEESLKICNQLLNISGIDDVVREGDIYSVMLEIYLKKKDYPSSYSVLEVLRLQKKVLTNYVDQDTINTILTAVGKKENISMYLRNSN